MNENSRRLAATWPYPRYAHFRRRVQQAATDWFASREFEIDPEYPYILANLEDWPKNIILPEVAQFIRDTAEAQREARSPFPLHKQIHNGLSSQALLFNLVGPMLISHDLQPLQRALRAKGVEIAMDKPRAVLEFEDRSVFNENAGQPTSIDLAILPAAGNGGVFIECKFVEQRFGGCSVFADGDCDGRNPAGDFALCYLHHIGRRYWDVAAKHGLLQGPIRSDRTCHFANHYQFFREILFALEKQGIFVLLSDERSPVYSREGPQGRRGTLPLLEELLPERFHTRVIQLSIQELVAELETAPPQAWMPEFKTKYGLN